MSRERFISPQIWSNEQVCSVSRDARLLFVGMITTADDCGFTPSSPHRLKIEIFPTDDLHRNRIAEMLAELVAARLVLIYGESAWLPTFFRWQALRWRSKSKRLDTLISDKQFGQQLDDNGRVKRCWPVDSDGKETSLNLSGPVRTSPDFPGLPRSAEVQTGIHEGSGVSGVVSCRVVGSDTPSPPLTCCGPVPSSQTAPAERSESPKRQTAQHGTAGIANSSRDERQTATERQTAPAERPTAGMAQIEPRNGTATTPTTASRSEKAPAEQPHQVGPEVRAYLDRWGEAEHYGILVALRQLAGAFDRKDPVTLLAHCLEIDAMAEAAQKCAVLWGRIGAVKPGEKRILPGDAHMAEAKRRLDITPEAAVSIMASAATPGGNGHAPAVGSASALGEVLGGTATKGLQERVTRRRKGGAA